MTTKHLLPVFCLALLSSNSVLAQLPPPPPLISVSGSAEVKVAPDEVYLSVGVQTRKPTLEAATQENNERMSTALAYLKKVGVEDKYIQTDYINIQPDFRSNETDPYMYDVRKSLQVKLTDVKSMESVLTGLMANGVNHVQNVDFRTSELRKYRDEARAMAIRAAKEKGTALAVEAGVSIDKVYSISANDNGGTGWWGGSYWGGTWGRGQGFQNAVQNEGGGSNAEGGSLSIGQISVSATVNVSFLIK